MDAEAAGDLGYGHGSGPLAVAHRGGAGLGPENTLATFRRSHHLGVRYLEADVRVTADGVCVAFHDADTRRATGIPGRVAAMTWAQLSGRRVGGEPVPALADLLEEFPAARLMLDLKDPAAIGPLAALLRRTRAVNRVCVGGNTDQRLADLRSVLGGRVSTAMGWESVARLAAAARWRTRAGRVVPAPFLHVPLRLGGVPVFAERLVGMTHDLGARVLVWTVDDPECMHRLLDAGVDGVITDRPDLLREVLIRRGQWHPPAVPEPDPSRQH